MTDLIDWLKNSIDVLPPVVVYLILFVSAILENIVPPIPGDTIIVFGAYLVGVGKLDFLPTYLFTTAGSSTGFMALYFFSLKLGKDYFLKKDLFFLPAKKIEEADLWFKKYGFWLIVGNRFITGLRTAITIFSGIARLNWVYVLVFATISGLLWNGILIYVGFLLGENWQNVEFYLTRYSTFILILLALILVFYLAKKNFSGKQKEASDAN
ncbi:DedA family protein [bacterium]|nr:DedA family protein [bacterium]